MGHFRVSHSWLSCFFLQRLDYVLVICGSGTKTNMVGKYRCQQTLATGNIEDNCESDSTFPPLLVPLVRPTACAAVTAADHDVGVFLAH